MDQTRSLAEVEDLESLMRVTYHAFQEKTENMQQVHASSELRAVGTLALVPGWPHIYNATHERTQCMPELRFG